MTKPNYYRMGFEAFMDEADYEGQWFTYDEDKVEYMNGVKTARKYRSHIEAYAKPKNDEV